MTVNASDHTLAARSFLTTDTGAPESGLVERFLRRVQVLVCSLHGHDSVLQYERTRVFLRCASCGFESPGWEVAPGTPVDTSRYRARPAAAADMVRRVA